MNNTDNEFLLRIQDKGNRFIFVDKKTDKEKANEQIRKSNLKKFILIQKVKQFSKIWLSKKFIKRMGIFHS